MENREEKLNKILTGSKEVKRKKSPLQEHLGLTDKEVSTIEGESSGLKDVQKTSLTVDDAESFKEYGVGLINNVDAMRKQRALNQSNTEKFTRAVGTGVGKGLLSLVQGVGHLADIPEMIGGIDSIEEAEGNWLVSMMREYKEDIDEEFQIYLEDPNASINLNDPGWYAKQLSGLIESAVQFAPLGAGVGSAAAKASQYLASMIKASPKIANMVSQLGTAFVTNYVETRMASLDLYKSIYDEGINNGLSKEEAEKIATKQVDSYMLKGKINVIPEMFAVRSIFKNKYTTSGDIVKKSFKERGKEFFKNGIGEYFEETSLGYLEKEAKKKASAQIESKKTGKYVDPNVNVLSDYLDHIATDEGKMEGILGFIGGPFQTSLGKAFKFGIEKASGGRISMTDPEFDDIYTQEKIKESMMSSVDIDEKLEIARYNNDKEQVDKLKNERFDQLAFYYLSNGKEGHLNNIIDEISKSENEDDDSEYAVKAKERLKTLSERYNRIHDKNYRQGDGLGLVQSKFFLETKTEDYKKLKNKYESKLESKKSELINDVKNVIGEDVDPNVLKVQEIKNDLNELSTLRDKINSGETPNVLNDPALLKRLKTKEEVLSLKLKDLESTIEDESTSKFEDLQSYKEFKEAINVKSAVDATYNLSKFAQDNFEKEGVSKKALNQIVDNAKETINNSKDLDDLDSVGAQVSMERVKSQEGGSWFSESDLDSLDNEIAKRSEKLYDSLSKEEKKKRDNKVRKAKIALEEAEKAIEEKEYDPNEDGNVPEKSSKLPTVNTAKGREKQTPKNLFPPNPTELSKDENPNKEDEESKYEIRKDGNAYLSKNLPDAEIDKDNDSDFYEFIEDPKINKIGVKQEFSIDKADIEDAKNLIKAIDESISKNEGSEENILNSFSEEELLDIPIKMFVLNDDGTRRHDGKTYAHVPRFIIRNKTKVPNHLERIDLMRRLVNGEKVFTEITKVGKGKIINDNSKVINPKKQFGRGKILISDGNGLVTGALSRESLEGEVKGERKESEDFYQYEGKRGFVYFSNDSLRFADGSKIPLKMNYGRLGDNGARAVARIFHLYSSGMSPNNEKIKTDEKLAELGISGLTGAQALDLIVYQGEYSDTFPLEYNFKSNTIVYGTFDADGKLTTKEINPKKLFDSDELINEFLEYLSQVPRYTNDKAINHTFEGIGIKADDEFEMFGQSYSGKSDYNDYIIDTGAIHTTAVTHKNSNGDNILAVNPWADYKREKEFVEEDTTEDTEDAEDNEINEQLEGENVEFYTTEEVERINKEGLTLDEAIELVKKVKAGENLGENALSLISDGKFNKVLKEAQEIVEKGEVKESSETKEQQQSTVEDNTNTTQQSEVENDLEVLEKEELEEAKKQRDFSIKTNNENEGEALDKKQIEYLNNQARDIYAEAVSNIKKKYKEKRENANKPTQQSSESGKKETSSKAKKPTVKEQAEKIKPAEPNNSLSKDLKKKGAVIISFNNSSEKGLFKNEGFNNVTEGLTKIPKERDSKGNTPKDGFKFFDLIINFSKNKSNFVEGNSHKNSVILNNPSSEDIAKALYRIEEKTGNKGKRKDGTKITNPYILITGSEDGFGKEDYKTIAGAFSEESYSNAAKSPIVEEVKNETKPKTEKKEVGVDEDLSSKVVKQDEGTAEPGSDVKVVSLKNLGKKKTKETVSKNETEPTEEVNSKDEERFKKRKNRLKGKKKTHKVDKQNKELKKVKQEQMDIVKSIMPNVPLKVKMGLLRIPGGYADGFYSKGAITLSDKTVDGVVYHEAFHAVLDLYLTEDEKNELLSKAYPDMSKYDAEESLAEDFRFYMLENEKDVQKYLKRKKNWGFLADIFEFIKELADFFDRKTSKNEKEKRKFFKNISKGKYAFSPVNESQAEMFHRIDLPPEITSEVLDLSLYIALDESGFLEGSDEVKITSKAQLMDEIFGMMNYLQSEAMKEGNEELTHSFSTIRKEREKLEVLIESHIEHFNFKFVNQEDNSEETNSEDEFVDGDLGIKNFLQYDGKENANGVTKLLLSTLVSNETSPNLGLNKMVPSAKVWDTLLSNLSDIVETVPNNDSEYISVMDKMFDKLESLSKEPGNDYLDSLVDLMKSEDTDINTKINFVRALSMQTINYTTSVNSSENGKYKSKIIDSGSNGKSSIISNKWEDSLEKEMFKQEDNKLVVDKDKLSKVIDLDAFEYKNGKVRAKRNVKPKNIGVHAITNKLSEAKKDPNVTDEKLALAIHNAAGEIKNLYETLGIVIKREDVIDYLKGSFNNQKSLLTGTSANSLIGIVNNLKSKDSLINIYFKGGVKKVETVRNNSSIFSNLAKSAVKTSSIPGDNVVIGPKGNYYTKSENHNMAIQMSHYREDPRFIEKVLSKDYHKHSKYLKMMLEDVKNGRETLNLEVFLNNRFEDDKDGGKDYAKMNPTDEISDRMNRLFNGKLSPLTFADKSTWFQLNGNKDKFVTNFENSREAAESLFDYVVAESERINNGEESKIKGHNKSEFYMFPEFNDDPDIWTNSDKNELDREIVISKLEKSVKKLIEDNKSMLEKYGIDLTKSGLDSDIKNKYFDKTGSKSEAIDAIMLDFTVNSIISNVEFTMMFAGDPSYYKDLSKRTPAVIATGGSLVLLDHLKEDKIERKFNVAVSKEHHPGIESIVAESYRKVFKESLKERSNRVKSLTGEKSKKSLADINKEADDKVKVYMNFEEADAQAYITHKRFKDLMRMLGRWTKREDEAYKRLIDPKGKPTLDDLKVMQPLKGVHFELRDNENLTSLIPTYLKYSQAVLWPALVEGTELASVLKNMENSNTHELVFESGLKVGADNIEKTDDITKEGFKFKNIVLDNKYWRLQQDLPSKYNKKGKALEGSQPKKNILANMDMINPVYSFNGKMANGRDVSNMIIETEEALSNIGADSIRKSWGIGNDGKIKNWDAVYEDLIKKFRRDKVSDNVIEALERRAPLESIFQMGNKSVQQMLSLVTKSTVKLSMPGAAMIQLSSFGFKPKLMDKQRLDELNNEAGIKYFNNELKLNGPRVKADGTGIAAQVLLPHNALDDIHKKHSKYISDNYDGKTVYQLSGKQLKEIFKNTSDGIVGYRIPNQGMSSIDSLEIIGILPKSAGDTMVTYREVTAKTGSDFDIDKMYVMMPNLKFNEELGKLEKISYDESKGLEGNSKEALQNRKLELYNSILMSKHTTPMLINPLDSEGLKEDAYYLAVLEKLGKDEAIAYLGSKNKKAWLKKNFDSYSNLEEFNAATQFEIKSRNMAGKAGVGQTANHLSHHPLAQLSNLKFHGNMGVGLVDDEGRTMLDSDINEDGELITDVISSFLNAFVDNAKDPYISLINNNVKTSNIVFTLLRSGVGVNWVNRFVSQPIIKDLVFEEINSESSLLKLSRDSRGNGVNYKFSNGKIISGKGSYKKNPFDTVIKKYLNALEGTDDDRRSLFKSDRVKARKFSQEEMESLIEKKKAFEDKKLEGEDLENFVVDQISLIKSFAKYKKFSTSLNDLVLTSKTDTDGATSSITEAMKLKDDRNKIIDESSKEDPKEEYFLNVDRLFNETSLKAYTENSIELILKGTKGSMFSANESVNKTIKNVIDSIGIQDNRESRERVLNHMKAFVTSSHPFFNFKDKEANQIENRAVSGLRLLNKEFPDNLLGRVLTIKKDFIKDETPKAFISSMMSNIDKSEANLIWQTFENMLNDDSTFKGGRSISAFAEDLVKTAFINSGFMQNSNSFFQHIPSSFLDKIGYYSMFNMNSQSDFTGINTFKNQFVLNNSNEVETFKKLDRKRTISTAKGKKVLRVIDGDEDAPMYYKYPKNFGKRSDGSDKMVDEIFVLDKSLSDNDDLVYRSIGYPSLRKDSKRTRVDYNPYLLSNNNTESEEVLIDPEVTINENSIDIKNIDANIVVEETTITEDGENINGYKVLFNGMEVESYMYVDKNEALNSASDKLSSLGFKVLESMSRKKCKS